MIIIRGRSSRSDKEEVMTGEEEMRRMNVLINERDRQEAECLSSII